VIKNVFLFKYHEILNVFNNKIFNTLISHRLYDYKIVLEKNAISNYIFLYKMFEEKLKIIKKYLENNLKKKFITTNRSLFTSSIMFMKKTNNLFKFCVDCRKLYQLIEKNRYSLLLIDETLIYLNKAKYFFKLDIKQTFHCIKVTNVEFEDLIIFRTRFNVYKYRILSLNK
jgi:hypothetical protein